MLMVLRFQLLPTPSVAISGAFCSAGGVSGLKAEHPGLQAAMLALFGLPTGVTLIVITGAELYSVNAMCLALAVLEQQARLRHLAKSWIASWIGNLVGALALAGTYAGSGIYRGNPSPEAFAIQRVSGAWGEVRARSSACRRPREPGTPVAWTAYPAVPCYQARMELSAAR
jgi:formate transporter